MKRTKGEKATPVSMCLSVGCTPAQPRAPVCIHTLIGSDALSTGQQQQRGSPTPTDEMEISPEKRGGMMQQRLATGCGLGANLAVQAARAEWLYHTGRFQVTLTPPHSGRSRQWQ